MGEDIKYVTVESDRAKRLRIAVYPGGKIVVTKPRLMSQSLSDEYVVSKAHWIERKLSEVSAQLPAGLEDNMYTHFLFNRGKARKLVLNKLSQWNEIYDFEYRRVSIKQLKSRWGSCSANGNMSFNYKILFLPEELQDFIVVHELCHLKVKDHSTAFWDQVSRAIPSYGKIRQKLQKLN